MVEKMFLKNMDIPYGVLHDQKLLSVNQENNNLIFTFEIDTFEEDYQSDLYLKYKNFNRCDMIVEMAEEPLNYFELLTPINNHNKFEGISLNIEEFINYINESVATFVSCFANEYSFRVELAVNFYKSEKLKKYSMCNIELNASNSVSWNWYYE